MNCCSLRPRRAKSTPSPTAIRKAYFWLQDRKYLQIASNLDHGFENRVCCIVGLRGSLIRDDLPTATALTRALLEAQDLDRCQAGDRRQGIPAEWRPRTRRSMTWSRCLLDQTHDHNPTGTDLKKEIALYAQELRDVQVFKKSTDPQRIRRARLCRRAEPQRSMAMTAIDRIPAFSPERGQRLPVGRRSAPSMADRVLGLVAAARLGRRCGADRTLAGDHSRSLMVANWRSRGCVSRAVDRRCCHGRLLGSRGLGRSLLWAVGIAAARVVAWHMGNRDSEDWLLPVPFFSSPQSILEVSSMTGHGSARASVIRFSCWPKGYFFGALAGFVTGVTIGWSRAAAIGFIRCCG